MPIINWDEELRNLRKLGEEGRIKLHTDMAPELRNVMMKKDGTVVEETISPKLKELILEIRGRGE